METPMDDVTQTADEVEEQEEEEVVETPPKPRPGDEKAYEDSWYQILRARGESDDDEA